MVDMSNISPRRYIVRRYISGTGFQYLLAHLDKAGWVSGQHLASRFTSRAHAVESGVYYLPTDQWSGAEVRVLKPRNARAAAAAELARRKAATDKAAPPVEVPTTEGDELPRLSLLCGAKFDNRIHVSALIPPGLDREVKVGDRVTADSFGVFAPCVLTVTEINGTLAQCSSHP